MTHEDAIRLFAKTLQNFERWMDKAEAHAKAKSFEVDVLVQARLAPDQFAFVRQVQSACDQAKYAAAYLGGKEPPSHPDTEQTFPELRQRIQKCLGFLESVRAKDLAGAEDRKVAPPWLGGRWLRGDDYLAHVAIPNFFFHATMAYAILRHNGVDLGKMDYIGSIPAREGYGRTPRAAGSRPWRLLARRTRRSRADPFAACEHQTRSSKGVEMSRVRV